MSMNDEENALAIVLAEDPMESLANNELHTPEPVTRRVMELPDRIQAVCSVRASTGRKDWKYIDRVTRTTYRSKKQVMRMLEEENQHPIGNNLFQQSGSSATEEDIARTWKPKSVTWVVDESGEAIPSVDGKEVPEGVRRVWAEDFEQELNKERD